MFNNVAITVATGLTFIFLLYSLLATTIKELVATIFAYRSRMLERGIEQMLDGKNYSYYWWHKVFNYFIWLFHWGKVKYSNVKIKSENKKLAPEVSKPTQNNIPLVDFMYARTIDTTTTPVAPVKRIALNDKARLFAANITSHALYKRAAENSLLSKKPAYLGADVFSDILIDVLGSKRPDTNAPILLKDISSFVNTSISGNPDLKKIVGIYLEQANGDVQRFKLLVETWYDDTMDRVSGWYKKQAYRILLMIGFVLAVSFKISTIDIVKKLSTDKVAREQLAANATAYIQEKRNSLSSPAIPVVTRDSLLEHDTSFIQAKRSLHEIDSMYQADIKDNNQVVGLGWGNYGGAKEFWRKVGFVCGAAFWPWHPAFDWSALLGFIITALAISLGAPFWFDLLNKFINLRVSGAKPDDKSSTPVSKTKTMNQKPDPTAKG